MIETIPLRMLSISLSGRKHKEKNKPCEDASMTMRRNGVSVVCLSDGAGSSQYSNSDMGSQCVVETVCELLTKHFDAFYYDNHEALVRSVLVAAIQSELTIRANELNLANSDSMAATMLFCAVKDTRVIFGHIGDGIIARITGSGLQLVTIPQNGEDISSTIFVTLPHAQNYLRLIRSTTDDTHAIVMMTDGLSDLVYDNTKLLLMPVVARLAEFGALPFEDGKAELEKTIHNFVIESSPLSDDASIGIIYFDGTQRPDPDTLVSDKLFVPRTSYDNISSVQHDILPRVQKAREILANEREAERDGAISLAVPQSEPAAEISNSTSKEVGDSVANSPPANQKQTELNTTKPMSWFRRFIATLRG